MSTQASLTSRFPHLSTPTQTPTPSRRTLTSVRIPFPEPARLLDDNNNTLITTAWSVLLRCYTGQDNVTFGVLQHTGPVSVALTGRFDFRDSSTVSQAVQLSAGEVAEHDTVVILWDVGKTTKPPPVQARLRLLAKFNATSLGLFLEWNPSLLSMAAAQGSLVAGTFAKILDGLLSGSPETCLGEIDCLGEENLSQICEWNRRVEVEPVERCVHDIITERVVEHPDKEAICAWDGTLTYRELDEVATRLARKLAQTRVVGKGVMVPLCFDKSKWTVVAMLAVLKAGAAFVPLDPGHPAERLRSLCKSVKATLVLCSRNHAQMLSGICDTVFPVDESAVADDEDFPLPATSSDDTAYVIFTSGSTGKPKGTIISHRAFTSSARSHAPALLIDTSSRILQFAAHTFDASLVEILAPLMVGGTICIPSEHDRLNDIAGFINRMEVNHAVLTPSFVRFLAPESVPGLQRLVLAGEAMAPSHVTTWSHIQLVNGYGPAESSVAAVVNSNMKRDTSPTDIGMPCGVRVWLADPVDHNRLVPVGCAGEMLLEGPSLATGYLNDPGKTEESFITSPAWAAQEGSLRRFYKTGDLARYNSASGSLSYLGRKDTQIKLHGQRIELGEIEHHLSVDESVKHAMVLLPKKGPLAQRLITVTSLSEASHPAKNERSGLHLIDNPTVTEPILQGIRERLSTRLPTYMVPVTWLCVHAIPMLPSRKMDRKSVATWVESILTIEQCQKIIMAGDPTSKTPSSGTQDNTISSPLADVEAKLRNIWSLVLNLPEDQISLDDRGFLSLGGDSISAMACASRAKKAHLDVTVQNVLRAKSVRQLAASVKATAHSDVENEAEEESLDVPSDLSPIQQLHFDVRGPAEGNEHFNQSFCLRLSRHIEATHTQKAIHEVVRRHGMLRARFLLGEDGKWRQVITSDVHASYRFRSRTARSRRNSEDGIATAQECLDVRHGPVLAAELITLGDGNEQVLFMTAHHLVVDLVSWRVILEEMEEILQAPSEAALPPVHRSLAFTKWTALQREDCSGKQLAQMLQAAANVPSAQFGYWGMDNQPNLYGDVVCGSFELDTATTSILTTDCHTPFRTETVDLLLATLIWSFRSTFDERTVPAIFNEGHGREALMSRTTDISRTVGWFTTLFPVALSSPQSFADVLVQVKDLRRRAQGKGRAQFAAQFYAPEGHALQHKDMEVTFNFLGRYQQFEREGALFRPAEGSVMAGEAHAGSPAADFGAAAKRFALFEISAVIVHGALRFGFAWNRQMQHQDRIQAWISHCHQTLIEAGATLPRLERRLTISDFALAKDITAEDLEAFEATRLAELTRNRGWDAIEDIYPASPIQQGLLLGRLKDDNAYAVRRAFQLKTTNDDTALSVDRAVQAWKGVVQYHALLRTVFVNAINQSSAGSYDQVVLKEVKPRMVIRECPNGEDEMHRMVKTLKPMGYADDGLQHRLSVFYSNKVQGAVFCVLEMSHVIMDGASMDIILRDLRRSYEGTLDQMPRPLFSPFVATLQQRDSEADLTYWRNHLSGLEPCQFPVLNDGTKANKHLRTLRVSVPKWEELRAFCNTTGITIPNALHAAWGLVLAYYTGTDDVCFGYLVSGRDASVEGSEDAVGPFINMATQRVRLGGEDDQISLLRVLEAVQRDQLDSMPFAQASLAEVQHGLNMPGGMSLFNTCVSYRRLLPTKAVQGPLAVEDLAPIHDPTEYPISLNVEVAEDGHAAVDLDYWTDMVASQQAEDVALTFIQALSNIIEHSEMPISQLDKVHQATKETIFAWNANMPTTTVECLHRMVEKQVAVRPEQQAIRGWDADFSYAEMDLLADRLANHLFDLGVGPGVLVPVCFHKSAYTTITMLAVLKAGGCVVPLNANDPASALEGKVADTGTHVVVASEARGSIFEAMVPYVVAIDSDFLSQLSSPEHELESGVSASDPAFVMFTSGSTGKPKGVILSHSALASSVLAHGSALGLNESTRFLQFAAHTFDNSIEEMFTTLIHGGCVCVPSEADRLGDLAGAIDVLDANFMDLTPTVAALLRPEQVPKIRGMAVGGEALTQEILDAWGGKVPLHNQYGPSECSINATHCLHTDTNGEIANIGTSVGSVSWVVDPKDHNRLVPLGCVGELLIEGPIVGTGYLNRPMETARSFIEMPAWATLDPYHNKRGNRRMYKTGDLVRYNSDGSLIYLGRKDTQVKLHGQRIEPGEIDHHVKACLPAGAQSSVELVRVKQSKALAVFVCLKASVKESQTRILTVDEDFASLAQVIVREVAVKLPSYMVPNLFFPVSRMPLTSSGKLDRRQLQDMVQSLAEPAAYRLGTTARIGRAPETPMEKNIQELWADVLNVPAGDIGADDSFFQHGGDSVGAMRLVPAARKRDIVLTVASIFQTRKLSDMAKVAHELDPSVAVMDASTPSPVEPFTLIKDKAKMTMAALKGLVASICRIDVNTVEDVYPCTPLQAGLVAASQRQPGAYVAVSSYELSSGTDISRFKKAWQDVVDSEAILRTRIVFVESIGFLQVVVRDDINWTTASNIKDLPVSHCHLPPHDGGILSRYTIIGQNTNKPLFVWTAHHALYDGWSLPTLLSRVEARYRRPEVPLVPTPQYSRFVEYLSSVDSSASDAFWTTQLCGTTTQHFPQLPHPEYRVQATSHASQTISFTRPKAAEVTGATFLRAAWAVVLSIYSASDDVVFGEVLNGRDVSVAGIEDLVGPTLASAPRRIRIDREVTSEQTLAGLQAQLNEVIPYQFAGLQRIKMLSSDTAAACDFQNLFVIDTADEAVDDSLWKNMTITKQGADFFSYPLNVTCTVGSAGQIEMRATFDDRVIPKWLVARMFGQFETVLARFAAAENQRVKIGDVDLLNHNDKDMFREWNRVPGPVVQRCVHEAICEQLGSQPKATAVVAWDASLSNAELDMLSTALAQELMAKGVGYGASGSKFVPFCMEKSAFAVVVMLAVLKAGGAFVPLDPAHPVARLQEIVGDCAAKVIVCSPKYEHLCSEVSKTVISIDMARLNAMKLKLEGLSSVVLGKVQPSDPAYVIFTSGTTGKPKGTIISHTAFCSGAAAHGPAMHMSPPFRFLQFASYTFDACLVEILTTLILGGTVCVPSDADRTNGKIAAVMEEMQVTMALLTPSFAKVLKPDDVPHLKTLILGGEAMSQHHVATWADRVQLVNAYGPSECAVVASTNPHMTRSSNPANLGKGIGRIWIVDPRNHHRLAPLGSVGELVVEGPTLSNGYLGNETKTREAFIENPLWAADNILSYPDTPPERPRRMYKTGDLVRVCDDLSGEMVYVGRKDASQAKLNGQRLELDEVAHHLGCDDSVRHAAVVIPKTGPCAKRLVAVLSLQEAITNPTPGIKFQLVTSRQAITITQRIQERLREKLPPYMIPSSWLVLATLPLLPSGKLDRSSVCAFVEGMSDELFAKIGEAQSLSSDQSGIAPGHEQDVDVHELLRTIWSQVLNISPQKITPKISFLHLGGDSITAMQVMARCRSQGISATVQDIIGSKSIHDLALKVGQPHMQRQQILARNEDHHEFDPSPIQQLYFDQVVNNNPISSTGKDKQFNQSVLLRLAKDASAQHFSNGLHALINAHSMLRTRFRRDGKGSWRQRITSDVSASYRFKTHAIASTDRMKRRIENSQQVLDFQKGPLMAADWFTVGKDKKEVCVFITVHHLVVDVVSWGILLQDLEDFLATGSITPPVSMPFQAWTRKQSEQAQAQKNGSSLLPHHETADADLEYWGMAGVPNLQADVAAIDEVELDVKTTNLLIGPECHQALQTETLDILLAALLLSYRNASVGRQGVPTIHNEGHGREVWEDGMDLSRTVGWFTTLYPVHLPDESSSDYDIVNAIRWVKDYRGRLAGKGRPYFAYRLLTSQGQEEYNQRWPVEVTFNYLGQMQQLNREETFLRSFCGIDSSINSASDVGKDVPRLSLIDVSAVVADGKMKLSFAYNQRMKHRDSLAKWAQECQHLLKESTVRLVQLTQEKTLSEFALLPLTYYGLESLSQRLHDVGISPQDVEDIYPCSPMQRGLLLSWMRDPEKYAYRAIFQVDWRRQARIDADRLCDAWQTVVQRHATLRTVFIDTVGDEGLMDQVVLRSALGRTEVLDTTAGPDGAIHALQQLRAIDYNEKKPPHRLSLCTTSIGDVFCQLEISHAICDGSSLPILLKDLADAYDDKATMTTVPHYRDYMAHIQSQPRGESLSYWRDYLGGAEPCLFPAITDGKTAAEDTLGSHSIVLEHLSAIKDYCADAGITLSTLLQFVWALVIRSYTGSDEVLFGYLASGRDVPVEHIENAVGAFINMLVCRLRIPDDTEVGEALDTLRGDIAAAMTHQGCSLAEMQHEMKLDGAALFNTAFTYQRRKELSHDPSPRSALQYNFISAEDPSEYAVAVNVEATDKTVEVLFSYWRNTVSDGQIKNVAATFVQVLKNLVDEGHDDRTIGEIDLVGTAGVKQICSWNDFELPRNEQCIHEIISQHAHRRLPSTPAVCGWDASFTYQELETAATALARYLISPGGVGPDVFVPLCFEKSAWTIVAQIAVLKAGGAFVNLDPAHPQSRLDQALHDVDAKLVLCSTTHKEKMDKITNSAVVVDAEFISSLIKSSASEPPFVSTATPSNAAYIIFTSGTTGKPKGTVVEHGSFCTGGLAHAKAMFMHSNSRVLQFASYTFDASVMETLSCLLVGGCVCVPSDTDRMNDVAAVIRDMDVTWTLLTPSVAATLNPESVPCLKTLVTGGEAMSAGHVERWGTQCALVNAYGPTECSVVATTSTKVDESHRVCNTDSSNIGTAVGGRVWVVDTRTPDRLVPVGAVGELVVEGRLVAREYLKEEEKTKKVFIKSPAWAKHDGFPDNMFRHDDRMYRTGDLVRYNSDGSISYVSRIDTQVKLNGRRIELGEIEFHCQAGLPVEAQAAVEVIVPANSKTKSLAVFFSVPTMTSNKRSMSTTFSLLRMTEHWAEVAHAVERHVSSSLPAYMVPQLFVPVSTMPWTTAGKLDRRLLRSAIQEAGPDDISSYRLSAAAAAAAKRRAPASEMEKTLQGLWESTLGLPAGSVGVTDSFFGVGGDSLTAIRLVGAARARKIRLSVLDIFEKPVLADMALACGGLEAQVPAAELKPIGLVPSSASNLEALKEEVSAQCALSAELIRDMYPCSPLQEGLVALANKQEGAYVAVNTLKIPDHIDLDHFKAAWQEVVETTDTLRTRIIHTASSGFLQIVTAPEPMEWRDEATVEEAVAKGRAIGMQNGGRLTRYAIIQGQDGVSHFVWAIHHALYDGWSLPMVARRVQDVYNTSLSGSKVTTTAPTASYVRFIQYLARQDMVASENYWKDALSGAASVTHFPQLPSKNLANHQTPKFRAETIDIKLNRKDITMDITIPTLIRAAWAVALAAYNGADDVAFGETLSGRNIDVEGIMDMAGPTFTTVPVRVQLSRNMRVAEFLKSMHSMASQVVAHQHFGLQRIMKLNADCAGACDFKNLLTIRAATNSRQQEQLQQEHDADWDFEGGSPGEGFFTHPLVLDCNVTDSEVAATFHYNENVISQWHTKRLSHQLEAVLIRLASMSGKKNATMADIDVISPEDHKLLGKWNRPVTSADIVDSCIHDLFLEQAATNPSTVGISAWDAELTYGEIRDYATRLAIRLKESGVTRGTLVPVCLDRSAWALVILLAILMAGGAFVPFDPAHPLTRQKEMLEELAPLLIVCSPEHEARFEGMVITRLSVDGAMLKALPPVTTPPLPAVAPTSTAYVLFTSGSTGRPKGVVVAHHDFCSSSRGYARATHIETTSRVFHFASLTFDVALMEVLTPLTMGACVCIPTAEDRLQDLGGAIARLGATWAFLTPSVANLLDPAIVCPGLKTLVCGGEAMVSQTIARWAGRVELINGYGPTEACVLCIVNPRVSTERDPTIIGRGTFPARTWILQSCDGRDSQLAPVGAVGELAISGPVLAQGYKADPEKTARAFIDSPAWAKSLPAPIAPTRIYRTGDLVRYRPDGSLEFLGRKDGQVKVNGQRIELGEIDSRLSADPRINHALVVQPKTGACRKQLVGVITLASAGSAVAEEGTCTALEGPADLLVQARKDIAEIKNNLSDSLPSYMVPAAWIVLMSMPVVVSGKLDRKRVSTWVEGLDEDAYEAIARNLGIIEEEEEDIKVSGTAKTLKDIWAKELQVPVEKIKSNKAFLSLGGDSIRAMGVVSRARTAGLGLNIQDVLRSKSVVHLAQVARFLAPTSNESRNEEESSETFALSPVQRMYMQLADSYQGDARFNQSNILGIARRVGVNGVRRAMDSVVQRHAMLRARFNKSQEGHWGQHVAKMGSSAYRCLEHRLSCRQDMVPLMAATQSGLSIQDGPVFAVDVFDITGEDMIIVYMVAHHLVVDIVSWRVILRDLGQALETGSLGSDVPASFSSWLDLQASHDKTINPKALLPFEEVPSSIGYWAATGPLTYGKTITESFELDEEITKQALVDCHEAFKSEPMDLFLAAIAYAFARTFTDRDVPALYTESHGREPPAGSNIDLSGTVGWFTTICPLFVPVRVEDALDTVRRVKDTRRAIPANGRPYFAHKYLTGAAASSPMEVLFNYLGGGVGGGEQQQEDSDSLIRHVELHENQAAESDPMATADVGPNTKRLALFEISAVVVNNKLRFSFIIDGSLPRTSSVRRWIKGCKTTLEAMVRGLMQRSAEVTLSDYPLLPLTYDDLHTLTKVTLPRGGITNPSAEVEDIYPCTPVQEGMLISQLRNSNAYIFHAIYNVGHTSPAAVLDAERIGRAWQKVVGRHASLRTVFIESVHTGAVFDQVVLKDVDCGVVMLKAKDDEIEHRLSQITMASRTGQPLLPHQVTVCTTETGSILMKLEVNHVAVDGGSLSIIIGELAAAYNGTLDAGPGPLFSDYVRFIQTQPANADTRYWMRYLKGLEPCNFPKLITDDDDTNTRTLRSTTLRFDRFNDLRRLSEQTQVTLANIMHAAWAFVLRQYTGSDDVCFGYLTADRDAPVENIGRTVGTLINMLCCRIRTSRSHTIEDIFRTAQDEHLESTQYQRCSLANVQHALGMSGKALYNTSISTQNHTKQERGENPRDETITFEMQAGHDPSEYAITVNIETSKDEEGAVFRYWSDHISDEQAKEMAHSMASILEGFLTSPAQTVGEYDEEHGKKITAHKGLKIDTSVAGVTTSDSTDVTPVDSGAPWPTTRTSGGADTALRSLWSKLLNLPQQSISGQDSFFEIGGDSITAMKLVGDAREQKLVLTVADVFQNPTLSAMAACIRTMDMDVSKDIYYKDGAEYSKADQYEKFSLLAASNIDSFLQASIVPQVAVFRGGLVDVLPATDFQSLAVSGALMESQFMLNYFYLDGSGPLNLVRLRRACYQLVRDLDILRTVFVPSGGRFLQVVLRTLRPAFDTIDLEDESLEDYTAGLRQRNTTPRLGEPFVEFAAVRHQPSGKHRILIRLSHAQYDGVCLPGIMDALQAAYDGRTIPNPPSFANYLRASAGELTSDHYQHWTKLLEGSALTELVRRDGPNYQSAAAGKTMHLQKTIHLPPVEAGAITTATVIKAAWAYVLAQVTCTPDVVFGHTISGRNASVDGVANMIGPCVNLLPVRVQFVANSTAKEVFHQIQDQQVANMSHEVIGFRDIIRHCTSWPNWTYFTSTVQHQNLEPNDTVRIGGVDYKLGCASTDQGDFSDLNVVSQLSPTAGENMYEITLSFIQGGPIPHSFAEHVLNMLCDSAESLAKDPRMALPSPSESSNTLTQLPFPDIPTQTNPTLDNCASLLEATSQPHFDALYERVISAWRQVGVPDDEDLDKSFFDCGGDVVQLAQLSWFLAQEGVRPKLEDLVARPSVRGHMALLLAGGGAVDTVATSVERTEDAVVAGRRLKKRRTGSPLRRAMKLVKVFRKKGRPGRGERGSMVDVAA